MKEYDVILGNTREKSEGIILCRQSPLFIYTSAPELSAVELQGDAV